MITSPDPTRTETVLLVDGNGFVRGALRPWLERSGYRVLEAADAQEALSVHAWHGGKIDLLVSDVILRGMTGRQLAQKLATLQPGLGVLFLSGWGDEVTAAAQPDPDAVVLVKPFAPVSFLLTIRGLLDARTALPSTLRVA